MRIVITHTWLGQTHCFLVDHTNVWLAQGHPQWSPKYTLQKNLLKNYGSSTATLSYKWLWHWSCCTGVSGNNWAVPIWVPHLDPTALVSAAPGWVPHLNPAAGVWAVPGWVPHLNPAAGTQLSSSCRSWWTCVSISWLNSTLVPAYMSCKAAYSA